jgi:predicted ribosomally synthesized peptide with SipW-like signal peptide
MVLVNKINPVARAVIVIGAVMALVSGVTFAALTSQATLTDNTLESGNADLKIDNSDDDSCSPTTNTAAGFVFNGELAPGEESSAHSFCLANDGDVDLDVTVYATDSSVTGTLDNSKVHFCFVHVTSAEELCYTRAQMLANFNELPGGAIPEDSPDVSYEVYVKVDADHGGSGFSVAPFDLIFDGTQDTTI